MCDLLCLPEEEGMMTKDNINNTSPSSTRQVLTNSRKILASDDADQEVGRGVSMTFSIYIAITFFVGT
jgi:hypothetical protein